MLRFAHEYWQKEVLGGKLHAHAEAWDINATKSWAQHVVSLLGHGEKRPPVICGVPHTTTPQFPSKPVGA